MSVARWEAELPQAAQAYLSDLLEIGEAVPMSARPMTITAQPPAPPPAASPERLAAAVADAAGLVCVRVPERPHPLWLRAGTTDALAASKYPFRRAVSWRSARLPAIAASPSRSPIPPPKS